MDWGLLAGGVSQGLNQAQQGANQGLLQGEQIRAGRAQEGLAGQHLGLQQQQLTNALAQQAWQRGITQQQLALHQKQIEAQDAYHRGMLGIHGGELGVKRDEAARKATLLPYEVDETKAKTGYYNARPEYLNRVAGARETANEIRNTRYAEMGFEADRRNAIMQQRVNALIAKSATMSPFARAQANQIQSRLRDMRQQFAIASHREEAGLGPAPGMKPIRQLLLEQAALEEEYQQLVNQQPGAPSQDQFGGATPMDPLTAMRKKWLGK